MPPALIYGNGMVVIAYRCMKSECVLEDKQYREYKITYHEWYNTSGLRGITPDHFRILGCIVCDTEESVADAIDKVIDKVQHASHRRELKDLLTKICEM